MMASQGNWLHLAGDGVCTTGLMVADNASVRHARCQLYKGKGGLDLWGVAEKGQEAITVADRLHPDLIMLDLLIAEMNSLDAARAMRRVLPNVPLILCSALDDGLSEPAKPMGVSEIVSKFASPALLLQKTHALVDIQVGPRS
jgi:DNA-binding NarL/FixJ family response regulator